MSCEPARRASQALPRAWQQAWPPLHTVRPRIMLSLVKLLLKSCCEVGSFWYLSSFKGTKVALLGDHQGFLGLAKGAAAGGAHLGDLMGLDGITS